MSLWPVFDCTAIRCADECTGSVQRAGDKDDRNLGKQWVGATFSIFLCLLVWLATGRDSVAALMEVQPRYMLLGGVIGAGITWTVIKSVDALGPARSALFIVVSQLAVAYLISLSGMFGMEKNHFHGEN